MQFPKNGYYQSYLIAFFDKVTYSVGKEKQQIKPVPVSARLSKHSSWDFTILDGSWYKKPNLSKELANGERAVSSLYRRDCLVRDATSEMIPRGQFEVICCFIFSNDQVKKKKNLTVLT